MFSVIVPVYNKEEFIRECIESILNQSYKDFELIANTRIKTMHK